MASSLFCRVCDIIGFKSDALLLLLVALQSFYWSDFPRVFRVFREVYLILDYIR